jgi:hypothetical protein
MDYLENFTVAELQAILSEVDEKAGSEDSRCYCLQRRG